MLFLKIKLMYIKRHQYGDEMRLRCKSGHETARLYNLILYPNYL